MYSAIVGRRSSWVEQCYCREEIHPAGLNRVIVGRRSSWVEQCYYREEIQLGCTVLLSGGDPAGLNSASPCVYDRRGAFADGVDECQLTTASDRRAISQVSRPMIDTEWRTAFNNGVNESSGLMSVTSGKAVKRESVKQTRCNAAKLN